MGENEPELRERSIRTMAWIGDAEFERELRLRLARRGDYPTDRLDTARAKIARAEAQAQLLSTIEPRLTEEELTVVRRARNTKLNFKGRGQRDVKAYRAATGLEALVAHWCLGGDEGRARFEEILAPPLETAIDQALSTTEKPRRG